jgi:acetyltransferase
MAASAPPAQQDKVRLPDGLEVTFRPIGHDDAPALQDLFAHMTDEDRRLRFFVPMRELSADLLRRLTDTDQRHNIALAALATDTGDVLGVVRFAESGAKNCAEFAIAVRSDQHGHGLGTLMMHRMFDRAAELGICELCGFVLRENGPMLHLCRDLGFTVESDPDDPTTVVVRRAVGTPSMSEG